MSIAPAPSTVHPPRLDPVSAAGVVAGTYAVVVKVDDDHHRRRLFLSLSSAERAAARARARGQGAEVVLVQVMPVSGWSARDAHRLASGDAA